VSVLGVLLAGGRGVRLRTDLPKALVPCAGRTLLARAHATLAALADQVVVVAPAEMALPVAGGERVADPPEASGEGPLAGLVAGLGARAFDDAVVLAVDLPLVSAELLRALRSGRGKAVAVLAMPGSAPQPLAAWYAPQAAARLAGALARGERSATAAALSLEPVLVADAQLATLPGGLDAWLNVNTPADLALAERRLSAREHA